MKGNKCLVLVENNGENDNGQDDGQDEQQAAALITGSLLISCCLTVLDFGLPGVVAHVLHVVGNRVELFALFADNLRHLSEEHVQIADALLDVADLLFALDDESLLEVDLVLVRNLRHLLLALQLLQRGARLPTIMPFGFLGGAGGGDGCTLLLEGAALEVLEFLKGGLEVARDLGLFVLLLFLQSKLARELRRIHPKRARRTVRSSQV